MRILPIVVLAVLFLLIAIMGADYLLLTHSAFRNRAILAFSLLGLLAGWVIVMRNGGVR